jgi:hypothetical protein
VRTDQTKGEMMRILQRSAYTLLLIVVTAGLFAAPVWAADWQNASDSLKTGYDDSGYADKSDDDGSRSGISEDSSKTGSHDSKYADKSDDDGHRKSGTWELELDGALEKTLKKTDFENSVSFGYRASWTDAKGNVFEGMPLWRLVALVDDKNPTGPDSFNNSLAIKGYQIIVSPDEGKSVTLDSVSVAGSTGYIVASKMNGKSIQLKDADTPLILVGSGVPSSKSVQGIEKIRISFGRVTPGLPVTNGSIAVSSTPSGAGITVDGVAKGTTPATLTGITPGSHSLVFTLSGYQPLTQSVIVAANQTAATSGTLVAVPAASGSISVSSTPSGAGITVDGVAKGTTPATLTGITPGAHSIVFTLTGYQSLTQSVTVAANQTANTSGTLVAVPTASGSISVSSTPSGAGITVDGVAKGTTPTTLTGITPGAHSIVFTLTGYQSLTQSVTVTAGQTTSTSGTLVAVPAASGSISVSSTPSGASITVDGVAKGTTPATLTGITPGSHSLVFTLSGYQLLTQSVTVTAGQTATTSGTLVAVPPATGSISVSSTPSGAGITVDGVAKGTTPATLTGITPGAHSIVFTLTGYQTLTQSVTVTAGQTAAATGTLVLVPPTTGSILVTSTPAGASVAVDGVAKGSTPVTISGITPGSHSVIFTSTGYQVLTQPVTVTAGQTATANGILLPILAPTSLNLQGAITRSVTFTYLGSGVNYGHEGSYTDSQGTVWAGMPLWYLVGMGDDTLQHGSGAFNDALSTQGFTITVTGKSGAVTTLDSKSVARSSNYIIANSRNGAAIPGTDADGPLKLVGSGVAAGQSIGGVSNIRLNL